MAPTPSSDEDDRHALADYILALNRSELDALVIGMLMATKTPTSTIAKFVRRTR